jgi:hypothetical protein
MPSASFLTEEALAGYVAGRLKAEQLVIAVAAAYYGARDAGSRERLRPLIDVIDRASPGIVELGSVDRGPGFDVRPAERPFPSRYEAELRRAAAAALESGAGRGEPRAAHAGVVARVLRALRRLFSASA